MKKAKEIMTTPVVTINGSATVAAAMQKMKEKDVPALLVEPRSEENAYGIVTETDIVYKVTAYGQDPAQVAVHAIMTKPCIVVNPDLGVGIRGALFCKYGRAQRPGHPRAAVGHCLGDGYSAQRPIGVARKRGGRSCFPVILFLRCQP